ncbi:aminodeoxychorismate synthase component I [Vibrio natriegens]|uniref:aminodeoxychorismate synthase component I n=1 Tax=Vibrio natriegens TaxID=691 RepID=UPI0015941F76|nr:aminodeoxychorismate synthase component I [Vibrio natriegens]NVC93853.1 aminodeoxychorismate synthase component I [Vibrio natriegens]
MDNQFIDFKALDYAPDLALHLFSRIQHQPWAMLLRSASETHIDSRFDILVANPVATLETIADNTRIKTPSDDYVSGDDPFSLLDQLQQQWLPSVELDSEWDLPFVGGALGYFSYDLGRRVEAMPELAEKDLQTADMAVGLYEWAIVVDHKLSKACIVGQNIAQAWNWLDKQIEVQDAEFSLVGSWQSNMTEQSYGTRFNSVQEYLLSGDCYQINLAQRFNAPYTGSEWQAYLKLESANQAPFSAFIRMPESSILSISPERFLELKERVIETKPIKGTRPRSLDAEQDKANAHDLQTAEKDQAENLMIVDLLRNDIGRVASPGSVHVPKLFDIESFPAVHHLVSTIRADLDEQYSPADLLRACFPGGSITGAPKVRAMQIIEELEPHRRSAYCGSIGYLSRHGRMDTSITIRTLVAEKGNLYAWAGGGVVADSECAAEYQETLDKLSKILPALK